MGSISWSPRLLNKVLGTALLILLFCPLLTGQEPMVEVQYRKVSSVKIQADGAVDEPFLMGLIEITPNVDILTTSKIRRSIELLYATGNFTNILVDAQPDGDRVAVTFILRMVYRFEFVHLKGNLGVSSGKIRKRLRLRKLEPFTPEKVLSARSDILAVLQEEGYYKPRVLQDVLLHRSTKRAELTYQIDAGPPAITGSLVFSGPVFFPENVLRDTMKTKPSRRFKGPELQRDLEKLEKIYDDNGFLEHNIRMARQELDPETRMQLEIAIDAGKQLLLTTDGYEVKAKTLRELLPIWADHSYNDDTLEEGKRNLLIYMQEQGYFEAAVEWRKAIEEEKILITYVINRGTLYEVSEIRLRGNHNLEREVIIKMMKTRESGALSTKRLVTRDLESDLSGILGAYRERGFPFARFTRRDVIRMPGGKLAVDIEIDEGELVLVGEIRLKGNTVITNEFFLEHFQQKIGEPLGESKVRNDSNYIVALYSDSGYPKIQLDSKTTLSQDKTRANIEYRIEEGEQVFIDRIVISGNYRTKREVITDSLYFAEDDPLSLRKIQESQSLLYGLQIFDRVDMQFPRPDNLHKYQEILLKLTESKPYTIAYGFGFETYNKLNGILALSNRNWFGTGRSISMQLRGGFQEGRVLFTYEDPRSFDYRLLSKVSIFAERRSLRDTFSYRSYGFTYQAEKKLTPERVFVELGKPAPIQKSLFFGYRFEDIDTFGTPTLTPEDRQFLAIHISSPNGSFARDSRDNPINPTKGNFLSSDLEWSTSLLGSESDYLKSFNWLQYFQPVTRTIAAASLRLGMATGFKETVGLPISQRFFAGGGRTIRGFDLDTAGPLDENGQPKGGNMLFILNLENRFPIYGNLGGVVFFDWGNVFDLISDFTFGGLRKTTGLGLRYVTAIGPVAFDWGYKLDRRDEPIQESAYEFYISIGHIF